MAVVVPYLNGQDRASAEKMLHGLLLRHIAMLPFGPGDGRATEQIPAAGTLVATYSVVRVIYPSPLGPMDDQPVSGPSPDRIIVEGRINRVVVNEHGASIDITVEKSLFLRTGPLFYYPAAGGFALNLDLYQDPEPVPVPCERWMRRGAMLALAQRAFTGKNMVRIDSDDRIITSIEIMR